MYFDKFQACSFPLIIVVKIDTDKFNFFPLRV